MDYYKVKTAYFAMKARCYNPNHVGYHNYGGRGISVCDRWMDPTKVKCKGSGLKPTQGMLNFIEDMGDTWFCLATLDRIDNNGNYEPSNCQWLPRGANVRKSLLGRKHSEDYKRKLSEKTKGIPKPPRTALHSKRISEANKGRIPWNKGLKLKT